MAEADEPRAVARTAPEWLEFWKLALIAIVLAVALYPVGMAAFNFVGNTGPAALPMGSYLSLPDVQSFEAPDAKFRAKFPWTPARTPGRFGIDGVSTELTMYEAFSPMEFFAAGSFALAPQQAFDLYRGMNGSVDYIEAHLVSSKLTTFQGYPAIEFKMTRDEFDGKGMLVQTPTRVYELFLFDRFNEARDFSDFKKSFEIVL